MLGGDATALIDRLDQEVPQYRAVIKFCRRGRLDHDGISGYLAALVRRIKMKLAVPGIVTGWCEKGLGGWAHITTSCISLMEYWLDGDLILVTIDMYSCQEFDLDAAAALTAVMFGVKPSDIRAYWVVPERALVLA